MPFTPSRLTALLLVAGVSVLEVGLLDSAVLSSSRSALAQDAVSLGIRRGEVGVEVLVKGVGVQPLLKHRLNGQEWEGRLQTKGARVMPDGLLEFSEPSLGLQRVSISGSGNEFNIRVIPVNGQTLSEPVVSADGHDIVLQFPGLVVGPELQSGQLDLNRPGVVPQARFAPSLRPRAVAPPLGDMAIGTMLLQNRSFVKVSGPPVTLSLNNAPAKDALMALARLGGYGFVFVADPAATGTPNSSGVNDDLQGSTVSMAFQGESYARALNSVLLASGLQGRLDGRTILVGKTAASKTFGPQMSKVIRLNQVSARGAAEYLGNLGATVNLTNTVTITSGQSGNISSGNASTGNTNSAQISRLTSTESFGASVGPLRGLALTTDSRLQTLTVVGDPQLVQVAQGYLRQIDLRQRQVALSVRVLDVALNDDKTISNSFAFRSGNNFIMSDRGEMLGSFGSFLPNQVPAQPNLGATFSENEFFSLLTAMIESESTKTLAAPTLILSENPSELSGGAEVSASSADSALDTASIGRPRANESFVTVGTQEIVKYDVIAGQNGSSNTCKAEFGTAGLTFGARVSKIDDNGFVSFALSPSIAAKTSTVNIEGCGPVSILSVRRLDTGNLRVRDGQTLILTGVITDADQQQVSKWPILGDIPLIGQFFRQSIGRRAKRELVILVTPRIIDDAQGGSFGYGYRPSLPAARQILSGS